MSKTQRAAAIKQFDKHFTVTSGPIATGVPGAVSGVLPGAPVIFRASSGVSNGGGFFGVPRLAAGTGPKVIGKDWLSVIATPPNADVAATVQAVLNSKGPVASSTSNGMFGSSSSSAASTPGSPTLGQPGQDVAVLRALLLAATPVHGSWGSGRLLQTKVVSVLITSKGQILAGAVTPAVLYADVAAAR
jgi:hypothetical protein